MARPASRVNPFKPNGLAVCPRSTARTGTTVRTDIIAPGRRAL